MINVLYEKNVILINSINIFRIIKLEYSFSIIPSPTCTVLKRIIKKCQKSKYFYNHLLLRPIFRTEQISKYQEQSLQLSVDFQFKRKIGVDFSKIKTKNKEGKQKTYCNKGWQGFH